MKRIHPTWAADRKQVKKKKEKKRKKEDEQNLSDL